MTADIILASGSERRRQLLDQLGIAYQVVRADVDESALHNEPAEAYVRRISALKAARVMDLEHPVLPILAADTAVVMGGTILGKPANKEHASEMLRGLSGKTHQVFSAVTLMSPDGKKHEAISISSVCFAPLDEGWISAYCATPEPMDKAGAYAIQGQAARFISRLEGSYSGVMGLPLFETMKLLKDAGINPLPGLNPD